MTIEENTKIVFDKKEAIPSSIIQACRDLGDKLSETLDPTKISSVQTADNTKKYEITKSPEFQVFISMLSRPTFNVAQVIKENGKFYSIGIDLGKVKESLRIYEVVADILLQGLVFGKYVDRTWIPREDYHFGDEDTKYFHTNNLVTSRRNYYVYDLESDYLFERYDSEEELLESLLEEFLWLFGQNKSILHSELIMEYAEGDIFADRIINRCSELVRIYGGNEGKDFFTTQAEKAGINDGIEGYYENFIHNVKLILEIFKKDKKALINYIYLNKDRAKTELEALEERRKELLKVINKVPE